MKYIAFVTAGLCSVILLAAWLTHRAPATGCADVRSSPMGTMMEGPNAASRLRWDDKCASGVGWVAK